MYCIWYAKLNIEYVVILKLFVEPSNMFDMTFS